MPTSEVALVVRSASPLFISPQNFALLSCLRLREPDRSMPSDTPSNPTAGQKAGAGRYTLARQLGRGGITTAVVGQVDVRHISSYTGTANTVTSSR